MTSTANDSLPLRALPGIEVPPARIGPGAILRHSMAIARRNLIQLRNDPEQLLDAMLMPLVITLLFVYVFGGAIGNGSADYQRFLIPGIMVQIVTFAARSTGIGMSFDFANGLMDRFMTLPIARSAVLTGRIVADMCRMLLGLAVMFVFALIMGFRVETDLLSALAALALLMLYGMAFCWVSAFIGLAIRNPETVQSIGFLWTLPLQFGSSMFVDPATMPTWLRIFSELNPTTSIVDASRALLTGGPPTGPVLHSLAWIAALVIVFAPLSIVWYRRRATRAPR
ncbi:ABC transporter permease [Nonomuraea mangrovi]|uniref:Transport permease protein n=1 Tax=Nonomuraea mangrovi TaxID=2316207 RepID=A0ABW4T1D8_9ACTN